MPKPVRDPEKARRAARHPDRPGEACRAAPGTSKPLVDRAREALAGSLNVPAVRVAATLGAPEVVSTLRNVGLSLPDGADNYGLSIALGSGEVTPLELAEAYATLARGGEHEPPHVIGARVARALAGERADVGLSQGPYADPFVQSASICGVPPGARRRATVAMRPGRNAARGAAPSAVPGLARGARARRAGCRRLWRAVVPRLAGARMCCARCRSAAHRRAVAARRRRPASRARTGRLARRSAAPRSAFVEVSSGPR